MPAPSDLAMTVFLASLPSAVRGAEAGSISDPCTGCRVMNANPKRNEAITWSGGCENGLAQGQGILQWYENDRPAERYEGELHGGQINGHGVLTTEDGGRYEGSSATVWRTALANGRHRVAHTAVFGRTAASKTATDAHGWARMRLPVSECRDTDRRTSLTAAPLASSINGARRERTVFASAGPAPSRDPALHG